MSPAVDVSDGALIAHLVAALPRISERRRHILHQLMTELAEVPVPPKVSAPTSSRNRFLHMSEVSQLTGIPVDTLRWWRKLATSATPEQYGPPSAKFGGRVVYSESDVKAWVAEQFGGRA